MVFLKLLHVLQGQGFLRHLHCYRISVSKLGYMWAAFPSFICTLIEVFSTNALERSSSVLKHLGFSSFRAAICWQVEI